MYMHLSHFVRNDIVFLSLLLFLGNKERNTSKSFNALFDIVRPNVEDAADHSPREGAVGMRSFFPAGLVLSPAS